MKIGTVVMRGVVVVALILGTSTGCGPDDETAAGATPSTVNKASTGPGAAPGPSGSTAGSRGGCDVITDAEAADTLGLSISLTREDKGAYCHYSAGGPSTYVHVGLWKAAYDPVATEKEIDDHIKLFYRPDNKPDVALWGGNGWDGAKRLDGIGNASFMTWGILLAETFSYKNGYKLVVAVQIDDRKATTIERAEKLTRLLIGRV